MNFETVAHPRDGYEVRVIDHNPVADDFLDDVIDGLSKEKKSIDPVYFYDKRGSDLFYQICELDEYYPTRTEALIFDRYGQEIANHIPKDSLVVELGGGGSRKIDALLKHGRIGRYIPTDVSQQHLLSTAEDISRDYDGVQVACIVGDYMVHDLPSSLYQHEDRAIFFPGSTIGNLCEEDRVSLLKKIRNFIGQGHFLVGFDLVKNIDILERAYDDREGLSAQFNLNLLARINRELGGDFDLDMFSHKSFFNRKDSRIEMHLESLIDQNVTVGGRTFSFKKGETIHSENSYKFTVDGFVEQARSLGFELVDSWTDDNEYFAEVLLKGKAH